MGFSSTILASLGGGRPPAPPAGQPPAVPPAVPMVPACPLPPVPAEPAGPDRTSVVADLKGNLPGLAHDITDDPKRADQLIRIMWNGCGLVMAGCVGAVCLALFLAFGLRAIFHGVHIAWPRLGVLGSHLGGATGMTLLGVVVRRAPRRIRRFLAGGGPGGSGGSGESVSGSGGSASGPDHGPPPPDGRP
ncbi:MAG: hypothetical protein QOF98_2094 [Streptomyces sp.]|nr:hypothetical protein [Streptomyces sp.]